MDPFLVREKLVVEYDEEGNLLDDSSDEEQETNEVNIMGVLYTALGGVRHN